MPSEYTLKQVTDIYGKRLDLHREELDALKERVDRCEGKYAQACKPKPRVPSAMLRTEAQRYLCDSGRAVARWLAREAEAQDVSVSRIVCELLSQAYESSEGIAEGLEDSHAQ